MYGYNFTERVRKVLAFSREEAVHLRHDYVGTEHILLALIREGEGTGMTALQNLGVDLADLGARVEAAVKKGTANDRTGPDLPYTSRAKKVLELAMTEARELDHSYVGTEHLLLGLLREKQGIAAQVLVDAGVTLDKARDEVLRVLGTEVDRSPSRGRVGRMWARRVDAPEGEVLPERMRVVLDQALTLAASSGRTQVEPVDVAIALVRHGEGVANAALERTGCDRALLLTTLESAAPPGGQAASPEALVRRSPATQLVLDAALQEQRAWHAPLIATHHLLVALLDTQPAIAAAFGVQGITAHRLREEARRIVG